MSTLFAFVGQDWNNALAASSNNLALGMEPPKKSVRFAASNMASQDAILKETTGTNQQITVAKGGVVQMGQSVLGRTEPLKFKATGKDDGKPLQINGKEEFDLQLGGKDSSDDTQSLLIQNAGNNTSTANLYFQMSN